MSDQIPADVQAFVREWIGSIAELELLLLLAADSSKIWTADEAARSLYAAPTAMTGLLERPEAAGLYERTAEGFRFKPASGADVQTVAALAELYKLRRLSIIELIYSGPTEKFRSIADAFRFRKPQ